MKRVMAYLAILAVATACSLGEQLRDPGDPVEMTPESLAGTWHAGTEGFITFSEDGTFTAINLPSPPFRDFLNDRHFDPTQHRLDGSGTWTIEANTNEPDSPHATVSLIFDNLAGGPARVGGPNLHGLRPGDGKAYLVMFYSGDGGNSYTGYLKCDSDCIIPAPIPSGSPR
jgi:hypothetical protein